MRLTALARRYFHQRNELIKVYASLLRFHIDRFGERGNALVERFKFHGLSFGESAGKLPCSQPAPNAKQPISTTHRVEIQRVDSRRVGL